MKKLMIGLAIAMLASAASAAILASDDFSYTGALTANGWTAYSGADGSITSDGNVASVGSGAEDLRFSSAFADQLAGDTFAAFNLSVSAVGGTPTYTFGFLDGTAMESRFALVSSGTGYAISIFGAGTANLAQTAELSFSTSYLITLAYDATTFTHSLWVNSDGTDEATPDASFVNGSNTGIDNFFIRQATGSGTYTLDNMVVGESFADVAPAPVPEPATMSLLGLGALAMVLRRRMSK